MFERKIKKLNQLNESNHKFYTIKEQVKNYSIIKDRAPPSVLYAIFYILL